MTDWKSYIDLDGTHVMQAANSPSTVAELLEHRGVHRAQIVQPHAGEPQLLADLIDEAWQLADFAARHELITRIQEALSAVGQVRSALNGEAPADSLVRIEQILLGMHPDTP